MTDIGFGLQGTLRSAPRVLDVKADDNFGIIYKTSGNRRVTPVVWSTYHVMASGADTVVASGVKFSGLDLVDYCSCCVSVVSGTQDGYVYINKDVTNNIITLVSTGSNSLGVNIQWMFGENATSFIF